MVQPVEDDPDASSSHEHGKHQQYRAQHTQRPQQGPAQQAPDSSQDAQASLRRKLPTAEEVRQVLRGERRCDGRGSSSVTSAENSQPSQPAEPQPALNWRAVVAAVRAGQGEPSASGAILTDSFARPHTYLRISVTERCNLRCLYCMPADGVDLTPSEHLLTTPEIMRLARLFASAGITKIRLTGGEPTIRKDIVQLAEGLAGLPGVAAVGLTTNGIALQRKLPALKAAGLKLLNISLDSLREERFETMTRRRGLSRVLDTIFDAARQGFDPVKVNVVVMRGQNDDELLDFVELTREAPLNVRFIEYMPFDGNVWSDTKMVTYTEMAKRINAHYSPGLHRLPDPRGEVAKNFRVPGFRGTVSFVTSMTSAFCGDCNRLRLMADGNLKVCLFGANEVSLRDAMREGATDKELLAIISAAVDRKKAAHAGMFAIAATPNRSMVQIGG